MKVKARKRGRGGEESCLRAVQRRGGQHFQPGNKFCYLSTTATSTWRKMPQKHQEWGILVRFRSRSQEASAQSAMYPMAMYETPGKSLKFPLIARRNFRYLNALEKRARQHMGQLPYFYQRRYGKLEAKPYTRSERTFPGIHTGPGAGATEAWLRLQGRPRIVRSAGRGRRSAGEVH